MIWDTPFDREKEKSEWHLVLIPLNERTSFGKDTKMLAAAKMFVYKEKNVSLKKFKEMIQKKIMGFGDVIEFKDLGTEKRIVNNIAVNYWGFSFTTKDLGPSTAYSYLYSDNDGTVAVITYTLKPGEELKKIETAMMDLLNGFCLLQK